MLSIIQTELLKLKRSWIALLFIMGSLANAIFSIASPNNNDLLWSDVLVKSSTYINLMIGAPLFALFAGFIIAQEYQQNTINQLFTYPRSRQQILIAKFIVIFLLIFATIFLSFLFTLLFGMFRVDQTLSFSLLGEFLVLNLVIVFLHFAITPIIVMLSILFKNYIVSIGIGIIAGFSCGLLATTPLGIYYPWSGPVLVTYDFLELMNVDVSPVYLTLAVCLVVPLSICFSLYKRADIHSGA
ncbi:ABC transporter permease [Gracilibacillus saliphilus]|uniref:ABC transporter permease n=1 Tax=Gracilibacillus saliphilus TaxID=543890 RepID=UPI0013D28FAB|nr:ABC transporter permease [Gracilibacillus saliphilus]